MFKSVWLQKKELQGLQNKKNTLPLHRNRRTGGCKHIGEMAEWSIAAVLKTAVLRGTGGSNPSLSAENRLKISQLAIKSLQITDL